ncbi:unnamed protein product [Fusarium graminearum]|nr:unnamed protein product [Fusarium graminearum]
MNDQGSTVSWVCTYDSYLVYSLSYLPFLACEASSLPSGSEEESTAAASPLHGYLSPRYLVEPGAPLQWQPGSPGRPPQRPASTGVKVPLRCKPQPPSSI